MTDKEKIELAIEIYFDEYGEDALQPRLEDSEVQGHVVILRNVNQQLAKVDVDEEQVIQ